ncbi:hypothetical protein HXZ62_03795 [Empedobacter falsenii]|uniref:hypothetical protein n=1 Tax=Empedobacter falsenii TaxID=343874 RepID=UPI0025754B48|nr:hypothetical protein [Empedobacter falsenii]MDM1061687.1 hypothetical protein [Empedobacter falsenii]
MKKIISISKKIVIQLHKMPIYQGTFTDKNGTQNIEIFNDFDYLNVTIDGYH